MAFYLDEEEYNKWKDQPDYPQPAGPPQPAPPQPPPWEQWWDQAQQWMQQRAQQTFENQPNVQIVPQGALPPEPPKPDFWQGARQIMQQALSPESAQRAIQAVGQAYKPPEQPGFNLDTALYPLRAAFAPLEAPAQYMREMGGVGLAQNSPGTPGMVQAPPDAQKILAEQGPQAVIDQATEAFPGAKGAAELMNPAYAVNPYKPVAPTLRAVGRGVEAAAPVVGRTANAAADLARKIPMGLSVEDVSKPLWEMSYDELSNAYKQVKNAGAGIETQIFGAEGAKRYSQLQRISNSSTQSPEAYRAADAEIQRMENALTEQQRNRLFGIGEPQQASPEDIRAMQSAIGGLDDTSPQALGESLKWAITNVGKETDPARMNPIEQRAYAQLRQAFQIVQEMGWNPQEVEQAAVRGSFGRFKDPQDAALLLQRFSKGASDIKQLSGAVPGALTAAMPGPEGETPEERQRRIAIGLGMGIGGMALGTRFGRGGGKEDLSNVLRRQAGTPEQAAQLRPPLPEHAGNVRLGKFPEESTPNIQQAFNEQNQYAGQRRGVVPDAAVRARAAELSKTRTIEDWINRKPGTPFSAEENVALSQVVERTNQEARVLTNRIDDLSAEGKVDARLQAREAQKYLVLKALVGAASGARAETGRGLRAFQQAYDGAVQSKQSWGKALDYAHKAIGGDAQQFSDWVRAWNSLSPDDKVGQYKMLQMLGTPSKMNAVIAWTVSNMVSAPRSILIDAFSNTMNSVERPLLTLMGGDPRAAVDDVVHMGRAFGAAWADSLTMLKEGVSPMEARGALSVNKYDVRPDAFPGKRGLLITPALRVKSAIDEFAQNVSAAGALASAARKESRTSGKTFEALMKKPSDTMIAQAEQAGRDAIFKASATSIGSSLINLRNAIYKPGVGNKLTGLAANVLVPFIRVPEAIYVKGTKKLLDPLLGPGIVAKGVIQRDPEAIRQGVSRAALSTMALTAFYALAAQGTLTGNGPQNVDKRRMLEEARDAQGNPIWQAHSVKIGDRWFDYTNLGPWAIPMAAVASAVEGYRMEGKKVDPDYAGGVFSNTLKTMADASYVRTLGTMFRSIGEGNAAQYFGSQMPADVLSRFLPYGGAVTQLERSVNEEALAPRNPIENFMARVPGLAENVPTRLGPLGTPIQQPQDLVSTFSPMKSSAAGRSNPVAVEMARLGMGVGAPDKIIKVGDQDVVLSKEQQRTLQERQGTSINIAMNSLMQQDYYRNAPNDEVKKRIAAAVTNKMRSVALSDMKDKIQGKESFLTEQMVQRDAAEFPVAYGEWLQWDAMPRKAGMSRQQELALSDAERYFTLMKQKFGGNDARVYAEMRANPEYGPETTKELIRMNNRPSDPRRQQFYKKHPLLQKWFRGSMGLQIANAV